MSTRKHAGVTIETLTFSGRTSWFRHILYRCSNSLLLRGGIFLLLAGEKALELPHVSLATLPRLRARIRESAYLAEYSMFSGIRGDRRAFGPQAA